MEKLKSIIEESNRLLKVAEGTLIIDENFIILNSNPFLNEITGFNNEELIGKSLLKFIDDPEHLQKIIAEQIKKGGGESQSDFKLKVKKDEFINVRFFINNIINQDYVSILFLIRVLPKNMINSLTNSTIEKSESIINQKQFLEAIFDNNIEGTFTIDSNWSITSFNSSAEKITGFLRDEAIGKKCWDIFKSKICRNGCHMEQTLEFGKSMKANELEIVTKQKKNINIRVKSTAVFDDNQKIIGAVETFVDITEFKNLSEHLSQKFQFQNIIGKSKEMQKIFSLLENVSSIESTCLITGESGTGKELVARAIHLNSPRRSAPFVAINCAAFAESLIESELFGHVRGAFTGAIKEKKGKFELAENGTLFLDEIADIPSKTQIMLLRVLERKEFERVGGNKIIKMNVRILAATNKDLTKEISAGRFREDLYHRLNILHIHLPPLRERMDDLTLLINVFFKHFNGLFNKSISKFSSEAYHKLLCYNFPGNIRELENIIESSFVSCNSDIILLEHLPERVKSYVNPIISKNQLLKKNTLKDYEKILILETLKKNKGNRKRTAEELEMDTSTLWRKMKKLNIHFEE